MVIHVVQPGETLYSIAGQYGADPLLLQEANGVEPGGALAVGQTLVIQAGGTRRGSSRPSRRGSGW